MPKQFGAGFRGLGVSKIWDRFVNGRRYESKDELTTALHKAGFENCELIVGIDFTKSNQWTGKLSFEGKCLHDVSGPENPYMTALRLLAPCSEDLDDDRSIPCYGFGDVRTGHDGIFSFFRNNEAAKSLESLVDRYKQVAPMVYMSGPTTFAPLIYQAMRDVYNAGMKFHMLLILADGQVSNECLDDTKAAIVAASRFPISIVMVGVGDGPWEEMQTFDDHIPERDWDNFQFVEFNAIIENTPNPQEGRLEELMYEHVLEEVPEQLSSTHNLTRVHNTAEFQEILNTLPGTRVLDPPGV